LSKAFFITLGFDEKFAVRALFRAPASAKDKLVLLIPRSDERFGDEKIGKVLDVVENLCSTIGLQHEVVEVPITDVNEALNAIYRSMRKELMAGRSLRLNFSGGMRVLILEALAAALKLSEVRDLKVEVELENLAGVVELPLSCFSAVELSDAQRRLVRAIHSLNEKDEEAWLSTISKESKIPRSTASRMLRELVKQGLLSQKKVERRLVYSVTEAGSVWV